MDVLVLVKSNLGFYALVEIPQGLIYATKYAVMATISIILSANTQLGLPC